MKSIITKFKILFILIALSIIITGFSVWLFSCGNNNKGNISQGFSLENKITEKDILARNLSELLSLQPNKDKNNPNNSEEISGKENIDKQTDDENNDNDTNDNDTNDNDIEDFEEIILDNETDGKDETNEQEVKPMEKVSSQEIINMINEGNDIYYENHLVEGDLDFTQLDGVTKMTSNTLITYVNSTISFEKSKFNGNIITYKKTDDLLHIVIFQRTLLFINCEFNGLIDMGNTQFNENVYFTESIFNNDLYIKGCRFYKTAIFKGTKYNSKVSFNATDFKDKVSFDSAVFDNETKFQYVNFEESDFYKTKFNYPVSFLLAIFSKSSRFAASEFNMIADFYGAIFYQNTYFGMAKFNNIANMEDIQFFGGVDFGSAEINTGNMKSISFHGNCTFSLVRFNKVEFNNSHFMGMVDFRKTEFIESADFTNAEYFGQPFDPTKND